MRKFFSLFLIIAALTGLTTAFTSLALGAKPRRFLVVIDPGHGGEDQGTRYQKLAEKDFTLLLALQTAEELKKHKIDVALTRTQDINVSLQNRTALANRLKADLFLSIHMNSSLYGDRKYEDRNHAPERGLSESAQGIETFILNHTTQESSLRLAKLENAVLKGSAEKDRLLLSHAHAETTDQSAQNSEVALILKDLRLDANLAESKKLACLVQKGLVSARGHLAQPPRSASHSDRGVKQALFYVLLGADMPSALVEAGFLSHPSDRAIMLSPHGQTLYSQALAQAIVQFRSHSKISHSVSNCLVR